MIPSYTSGPCNTQNLQKLHFPPVENNNELDAFGSKPYVATMVIKTCDRAR